MSARSRRAAQTLLGLAFCAALLPAACSLPDYRFVPGGGGSYARPRCNGDAECEQFPTTRTCDPSTGTCVECLPGSTAAGCGEGLYCNVNRCSIGCSSDADCGAGLTCDLAQLRCVGCSSEIDCPQGTRCEDAHCAPGCDGDEDCPDGFSCCGGSCSALLSDPLHCGGCNQACELTHDCINGHCGASGSCRSGWGECDGNPETACETPTNTARNCGACDRPCELAHATSDCSSGVCRVAACEAGFADCDPESPGCETEIGNQENCAGCGDRCETEDAHVTSNTCVKSNERWSCQPVCWKGFDTCDGKPGNGCEADLESPEHCGACGRRCKLNNTEEYSCVAAECLVAKCAAPFGDCDHDASNGCELDLGADPKNCGQCQGVCATTNATASMCVDSTCQFDCKDGFKDCNGIGSDGCEQAVSSDPTHCGDCETQCQAGAPFCIAGVCRSHLDITVVNHDTGGARSGGSSPLTFEHRLQSAPSPRRLILLGVATRGNSGAQEPSAVTYNVSPMQLIQQARSENQAWAGIYALANSTLAPGSYRVTIEPANPQATFAMAGEVIELGNVEAAGFLDSKIGGAKSDCKGDPPLQELEVLTEGALVYSALSLFSGASPSVTFNGQLVKSHVSPYTNQLLLATGTGTAESTGPWRAGYAVTSCNTSAQAVVAIKPAVTLSE